jgi:hypothetical protein
MRLPFSYPEARARLADTIEENRKNMRESEISLEDAEFPEKPAFTETEVAALVEEMRAKCEEIANRFRSYAIGRFIASDIAKLKAP